VRLGTNLAIATLNQQRDSLDPASRSQTHSLEARRQRAGERQRKHVVSYMKDSSSPGGRRVRRSASSRAASAARLMLAQTLAKSSTCWCSTSRPTTST